jgi:restriction endonuclease S subunit
LDKIDALDEEILRLKEDLRKADDDRVALEDEHRRRMGEEQRQLIQEAEKEMFSDSDYA